MSQNRFSTTVGQFQADVRGNVAIIFSLAAIPLMFMTGAAIDYGFATRLETKLQTATDATARITDTLITGSPDAICANALRCTAISSVSRVACTSAECGRPSRNDISPKN